MNLTKIKKKNVSLRFFIYAEAIKETVLSNLYDNSLNHFAENLSRQYDILVSKYSQDITDEQYNETCANFMREVYSLLPVPDTM